MIAGLGQIKAAGVHNAQRSDGIDGAIVFQHIDIVCINSSGCGQQLVLQMSLGHVLQITGVVNDLGVTGIVLDQAQQIGDVNVAQLSGFSLGDDDLNAVLQQGVTVIGRLFGDDVLVIFQALDDDLTGLIIGVNGNEQSCLFLSSNVVDDIVNALFFVQLGLDKVAVGCVLHNELDIFKVALAVGEQLGQLQTVNVQVSIVDQSVVVILRGTLPQQDNFVGVAGVTIDNGCIGIHGCLIGNTDGAVRIAGVDHACFGVNSLGGVDFSQTLGGHLDGHDRLICGTGIVGNRELAISFIPGGDQFGAVSVGEEFQNHIVLVVGDALGQGVDEGICGQVGCLRGNRRQSGNDLVVDNVTVGSGAGMGIAIGNVVLCAVILAGVVDIFAQGLLQAGDTSQVLGIQGHIIDPAGAAISCIVAIDGGHGQADEEGIASHSDHFRHGSLKYDIKTQVQA